MAALGTLLGALALGQYGPRAQTQLLEHAAERALRDAPDSLRRAQALLDTIARYRIQRTHLGERMSAAAQFSADLSGLSSNLTSREMVESVSIQQRQVDLRLETEDAQAVISRLARWRPSIRLIATTDDSVVGRKLISLRVPARSGERGVSGSRTTAAGLTPADGNNIGSSQRLNHLFDAWRNRDALRESLRALRRNRDALDAQMLPLGAPATMVAALSELVERRADREGIKVIVSSVTIDSASVPVMGKATVTLSGAASQLVGFVSELTDTVPRLSLSALQLQRVARSAQGEESWSGTFVLLTPFGKR
jgi:hypothetical protein